MRLQQKSFGFTLVTHQTGPKGQLVRRVLVEEGLAIAKELYLSLVLDRENERIVLMGSTEGGMEIEQVAKNTPEKIIKESIDPIVGLQPFQIRNVVAGLALWCYCKTGGHLFERPLPNVYRKRCIAG